MSENVCEAFAKLCDLALTLGAGPMNKHPSCWEHQVDAKWWVAFNGHQEAKLTSKGQVVSRERAGAPSHWLSRCSDGGAPGPHA